MGQRKRSRVRSMLAKMTPVSQRLRPCSRQMLGNHGRRKVDVSPDRAAGGTVLVMGQGFQVLSRAKANAWCRSKCQNR